MDLKRGVEMAVHATVDDLKKRTKKIRSSDEISQIYATISAVLCEICLVIRATPAA